MHGYLKKAKIEAVAPPASRLGELAANRVVAAIVDYPTAVRVKDQFDWAEIVSPPKSLLATPFGYVVAPGDQIWLNYLNVFVDTIKRDGTLAAAAKKNKLGPILIP
jgi:ABC-type amino acid transport substrate-binding protein